MTTNWNLTSDLVADRRAARESAAQRHRLLKHARSMRHPFSGRHADVESASASAAVSTVAAATSAPTTGSAQRVAA